MANEKATPAGEVKITLVRSTIGRPQDQENAVRSLGLRKLHQSVTRKDDPSLRGAIRKIQHLVTVEDATSE